MNYVLLCVKCKRPAELEKQSTSWREGVRITNKVYKKECPACGGKIKPMID